MGTTKSDASSAKRAPDLATAIELSGLNSGDRVVLLGLLNLHNVLENVIVNACGGLTGWADWVNVSHLASQVQSLVGPKIMNGGPEHV